MKKIYIFSIIILLVIGSIFTYGYLREYRPYAQMHSPLSFKDMLSFMTNSCFTGAAQASKNQDLLINSSSGTSTTSPQFVYIDPDTSPMGVYMKSSCGRFYMMPTISTN